MGGFDTECTILRHLRQRNVAPGRGKNGSMAGEKKGVVMGKSWCFNQWKFQDPKMQVLYHIRPYFVGNFPYIGLT